MGIKPILGVFCELIPMLQTYLGILDLLLLLLLPHKLLICLARSDGAAFAQLVCCGKWICIIRTCIRSIALTFLQWLHIFMCQSICFKRILALFIIYLFHCISQLFKAISAAIFDLLFLAQFDLFY